MMKGRHLRKGGPAPGSPEALRKSLGVMDRILIILGFFLFLFVVTMIVLFALFQSTPDTLIIAVFGFCGFECGAMAVIQRKKTEIEARLKEAQGKDPPDESEDNLP